MSEEQSQEQQEQQEQQKKNPAVTYLGPCPVCGKGQIAEGNVVYRCNYIKDLKDDKCDFRIFKTYNGAEITPEHVKQLLKDGKTEIIEFTSQAGNKFNGYLTIEGQEVEMKFANGLENLPQLEAPCPICGEPVYIFNTGYGCKNIHELDENGEKKCNLWISKTIAGRAIKEKEAEQLLLEKKTGFLDGFRNNQGNLFSTRLVLDDEGNIHFDSTVCKCPKCGGDVKIGNKSYNCSNWKTTGCTFNIWREIAYRKITPEEVQQLCEDKATKILEGFKNKDKTKTFSGQLILSDDFAVKIL